MISIVVVDDHPIVRDGLRGIFTVDEGFTVVGEAGDGAEAVAVAERLRPDVVLMDLRMPGTGGVEAINRLTALGNPARVLVLTTYDTDSDTVAAIEAGATGYLLKDTPRDELVAGVRAAARGQTVLAPSVATRLVTSVRGTDRLTDREVEVLRLVARGLSNAAVGRELFITEATVKTHLLRAFAKLGVDDRTAAVTVAMQRGFLPDV